MKRWLLLAAFLLALPLAAQNPCDTGNATIKILGPEANDVLWHRAEYLGFWRGNNSGTVLDASYGALHYQQGYFYSSLGGVTLSHWGGQCPAEGVECIAAVSYWDNENTVTQRAWYAVESYLAVVGIAQAEATMREVPQPAAAVESGTVTLTWAACPETEITGYQVVRSADGLANWTNVGSIVTDPTQTDTPGQGAWYYALLVRFKGTPADRMSPKHGLAVQAVVP